MPPLLRPHNLFILGTYLLLSSLPYIPFFLGQPVEHPLRIACIEVIAWLFVWSVFRHPSWLHWLLIPAFLALPIELYLRIFFHQGISTHHLGIIAETSPREALEFLGNKIWLLIFVFISVIAWWWLTWKSTKRTQALNWRGKSAWMVLISIFLGAGIWLYGHEFGIQMPPSNSAPVVAAKASLLASSTDTEDEDEEDLDSASASATTVSTKAFFDKGPWAASIPRLPSWAHIPFEAEDFERSWPFGLPSHGYDFWKERKYLIELTHNSNLFKFGAHQAAPANSPQVIVMVIGESSRYDRWSLNGYARETNPLLKKEQNLVSMSDVITSVSATRLSVPVLVSRKPATQSLKAGFSEKSFITAFKEAGFKTYWISNQMSFGQFDTPVSVYANEADVTQFLNLGGFTNKSNFDDILLEPLKNAMDSPAQKKLIVLHTLGNHWNYSHRYPKEYDQWKPSLFGVENPAYTDLKIKTQLNNSYDSSILYTDWILSQVIAKLKATDQLTAMMYVSDHGQTLYDGSCNLAFHGHNTQYEFHVPALVWYSDKYKSSYPDKVAQLVRNKQAKLATENVFHSLLDLADIRYSSEQLDRSFLSKKFKRHKRYVDSYGWTNYDNATFKGDCREVIDKGRPLTQEK